jgi:hypothetical protein
VSSDPLPGYLLIAATLQMENILEEIFAPPPVEAGGTQNPASELSLRLRIEYSVLAVREIELQRISNQILDANLPTGYVGIPETIRLTYRSPFSDDGLTFRWKINAERQIQSDLSFEKVAELSKGQPLPKAIENLRNAFDLAAPPEVILAPEWWPLMPAMPMRIQLIPGPAPATAP